MRWLRLSIILFLPWACAWATDPVFAESALISIPKTYPIASPPQSIVTGDFNRDGMPDLAVAEGTGKEISVYLGDGTGGFSPPKRYPVSNSITGFLMTEDFNRDGIPDLVVLNTARSTIAMLLGDGAGGFSKAKIVGVVQGTQTGVAGDFNHDGKPDLVVSSEEGNDIAVLLGDGRGGFSAAAHFSVGQGENQRHMVAADFNKDGNPDVAVTEERTDRVILLFGNGKGQFSSPKDYKFPEGSMPRGMTAGDFNQDGKADLAVVTIGKGTHKIWILLGNGKGGFTLQQTLSGHSAHWSVTTADFNGDGKPDLAVHDMEERVTMFLGQGGGLFSSPIVFPNHGGPADQFYNTIVAGDFNHDGFPDLATASEVPALVTVLLNGLGNTTGVVASEEFYRQSRPIQVSQLVVNPKDPNTVYLATVNQGLFRSTDRGARWQSISRGIKNMLVYTLVIDPSNPRILYTGTWGGGLYKTDNGGDTWREIDEGLTHTAVNGLVIDPENPKILYASTSIRVFKSIDAGEHWFSLGTESDITPVFNRFGIPTLTLLPSPASTLFVGSDRGLLMWPEKEGRWVALEGPLKDKTVTASAYDPSTRTIYLTTNKFELLISRDEGKTWRPWSEKSGRFDTRAIIISPNQPQVMYILDDSRGLLKTTDGGQSWFEINSGIDNVKVRALAVDPAHPDILYLGTYADGLFGSTDGGQSWKPLKNIELQSIEDSLATILAGDARNPTIPPPPMEFAKCNGCHTWTEPTLRIYRTTFWGMKASRRNWGFTIQRMGVNADLTPEETANIITYMNTYYGLEKKN